MQKMRLAAAGHLSCFFILMSGNAQTVLAQPVLEVSLLSDNISSQKLSLDFSDNQARCTVMIAGKAGTRKITGTLKLYDETEAGTVNIWTASKEGSIYNVMKTAAVKSGHRYRLSFSGSVYDADNKEEKVSISTVKTNECNDAECRNGIGKGGSEL